MRKDKRKIEERRRRDKENKKSHRLRNEEKFYGNSWNLLKTNFREGGRKIKRCLTKKNEATSNLLVISARIIFRQSQRTKFRWFLCKEEALPQPTCGEGSSLFGLTQTDLTFDAQFSMLFKSLKCQNLSNVIGNQVSQSNICVFFLSLCLSHTDTLITCLSFVTTNAFKINTFFMVHHFRK